jgi:hypothetical protein
MPEKAFEELRSDLATAGSKKDLGDIAGAYGYLSRGVRIFLEQWMAEQERKDDWATAQEADQFALDVRLEQGAYR